MAIRDLESFVKEIRDRRELEAEQLPERCPLDGTVLDLLDTVDGRRVLHCSMGNYALEV